MKKEKNRTPSAINLTVFAGEHLFYEIQMFLAARVFSPGSPFEKNAKVEVSALHLRNLIKFLYPSDNPKDDDVIAADYLSGWNDRRPEITTSLKMARVRANKEMGHLRSKRIEGGPPKKAWDFDTPRRELRSVISTFVDLRPAMPEQTISLLLQV